MIQFTTPRGVLPVSATEAPGAADSDISSREPHCLVEQRGHVLIVTLNRPEARNALSGEMMAIMSEAWDRVDNDPEIRVAILTGAGGAFCAGADLKAMNAAPPGDKFEQGERSDGKGNGGGWDLSRLPALLKGRRLTKPLIAAVEGAAIAGGTEILQGTDIRVAGESAKFGVSEAKWGLFPLGGSAVRLVRQIPYTIAADILLTGRHIKAAEAKEIGLIGYVVPDGTALDKALEIAETIANNGPLAVQAILRTIRDSEGLHEEEAFRIDAELGAAVFKSADAKEGPRAFAEKRAPKFTGS
ncbi:crotonase/enoyl-CoA hydratase family protein [Rhodococcus rhodochrous]|uniref:Enoyl-CoA hydratase EchA19 n=1 Tax=Rhodococcus rhodochrous TaxID=1829 RepID=A0AA47AC93_RHORH|nr:crotonase/enoyl-CoA hydratase family protein [Rhodococcus rhodochrous]MCD2098082.1 crotonase/enoyl-CoA hydratase family protein [Rhodococcus rhodochrous]MCD2122208.1 crotonase/enoyl-CoA hydratase family protein [Rhodococcus rhodochrous]MCQ4133851.1 crotonase/enoyl-CoA hydratase family protein [Rhodococcus rhodochrous]MDJ0019072.1 crotonase/enoyl-CoA hydratase family protein [Rhodococcus rhodochrous]UZF45787.1 crotonase/enoyl-CoA hydratase family protein [Rhodococcus rhodochrous]